MLDRILTWVADKPASLEVTSLGGDTPRFSPCYWEEALTFLGPSWQRRSRRASGKS